MGWVKTKLDNIYIVAQIEGFVNRFLKNFPFLAVGVRVFSNMFTLYSNIKDLSNIWGSGVI